MSNEFIKGKRRARRLALQALYQWHMSGGEVYEIEAQFLATNDINKIDTAYFHQLLSGVITHHQLLETTFSPYLDRSIDQLNPVELSVLRLGSYELLYCFDLPYRIVLDEAVSLAKLFGSQDGHRYVNGVLNNLARQVRTVEVSNDNPS